MKIILLGLTLLTAVFSRSGDRREEQNVYRLFEVMKLQGQLDATVESMANDQILASPILAPYRMELNLFYRKALSFQSLKKEFAALYLRHFTDSEIQEMIRFYESPVGRKMADAGIPVQLEMQRIYRKRLQEHAPELQNMLMKKAGR